MPENYGTGHAWSKIEGQNAERGDKEKNVSLGQYRASVQTKVALGRTPNHR